MTCSRFILLMAVIGISLLLNGPASATSEPSMTVLGIGLSDIDRPDTTSGLVADDAGNLYGTSDDAGFERAGLVYRLAPPVQGTTAWRYTALCRFKGGWIDGFGPCGGLARDAAGDLYGATEGGGRGGGGIVFRLSPPSSGSGTWTETILYSFADAEDGGLPRGALVLDRLGAIYGVIDHRGGPLANCPRCGAIYRLTERPGGGEWVETILYRFQGGLDGDFPFGDLIFGRSGALLGVTQKWGRESADTVFALTPPAAADGAWSKQILYRFQGGVDGESPSGRLALASTDNLFGTTAEGGDGKGGTVYRLAPASDSPTGWRHSVLQSFVAGELDGEGAGPASGVAVTPEGALLGIFGQVGLHDGSGVFRLEPPADADSLWHRVPLQRIGPLSMRNCYPSGTLARGLFGAYQGVSMQCGKQGGALFTIGHAGASDP